MAAVEPPTSGPYTVANILGPTILGSFGAGLLQGLLFCQSSIYFAESKDGRVLKGMVIFINFIALYVNPSTPPPFPCGHAEPVFQASNRVTMWTLVVSHG
jgi:hypothetical protein